MKKKSPLPYFRPNSELRLTNEHSGTFAQDELPEVHVELDLLTTCERCGREFIDGRQHPVPICDDCTEF